MTEKKTTNDTPKGELLLYQTEDGRTRIECRFEGETVWLTQAMMAELFQTTLQNVSLHLQNIYEEGELDPGATIKSYLIVRTEGTRQVRRTVQHYNLEARALCRKVTRYAPTGRRNVATTGKWSEARRASCVRIATISLSVQGRSTQIRSRERIGKRVGKLRTAGLLPKRR